MVSQAVCVTGRFKIRKLEATIHKIVTFSLLLTCVAVLQLEMQRETSSEVGKSPLKEHY